MARGTQFQPDYEPMRKHASLQLLDDKIYGPFSFLNPTQAHYQHTHSSKSSSALQATSGPSKEHISDDDNIANPSNQHTFGSRGGKEDTASDQPVTSITFKWTSRDNRKGRHALVVKPAITGGLDPTYVVSKSSSDLRIILHNIWLMLSYYPIWDISWWVAYIFTWGSIVWVINGFFAFLPDVAPSTEFKDEILTGGGVTAFIGATIFELGSILLMIEAINENREGCFGWAVEKAYEEHFSHNANDGEKQNSVLTIRPDKVGCRHHHQNKKNLVGKPVASKIDTAEESEARSFRWFCSWKELKTHYLHELGFLACSAQMFGASVFWISGFTALPGINNLMSQGLLDGIYWTPQVIGGSGFIVSGVLFMVETQKHWWLPAPSVLGWNIGLWNFIGGLGFTLCPAFGYDTSSWSQYQAR